MTYQKWKDLNDEGYSADAVSLLQFLRNGEELELSHLKTSSIVSLLERKGVVAEGKITQLGEDLLESLGEEKKEIPVKPKESDKFEEWWKVYPSTDAFEMDGRVFAGVQSKKKKKPECKKLFLEAIKAGHSADDIIRATAHHIQAAKKLSFKKGESQLTYISGSEIYLRNKAYEPYIEASKIVQHDSKVMVNPNELWNK